MRDVQLHSKPKTASFLRSPESINSTGDGGALRGSTRERRQTDTVGPRYRTLVGKMVTTDISHHWAINPFSIIGSFWKTGTGSLDQIEDSASGEIKSLTLDVIMLN